MRVSPDGMVAQASEELEGLDSELEELERELASKRAKRAQLRREHEMTPQERAKIVRTTLSKCRTALDRGDISLETFCSVSTLARGIRPSAGGTFSKSVGPQVGMSINQQATLGNLHANGLGHLVGPSGDWR